MRSLILAGGGLKVAFQAGVLQVWLDEAGIVFDHADGASGGCFNLAMYCQGLSGKQIADNWRTLASFATPAECAAVVKADAYGCGIEQVVPVLVKARCKTFFVASLDEGRVAREVQPGATVYVLDGLLPGAEPHYAGFDLRPVLGSIAEVRDWAAYSRSRGRRRPCAAATRASSPRCARRIPPASSRWL